MRKFILSALIVMSLSVRAAAYENTHDVTASKADSMYRYELQLSGVAAAGRHAPFWLVNNRFGLSSIEKTSGYLRASVIREETHDRPFSWDFGADIAVTGNYTSRTVVQQLYGAAHYKCLSLTVGSKQRPSQVVAADLSSGDLLSSGNARPVPEARLGIERWTIVPWTKRLLSVKGYFSFGAFTDQNFQYDFTAGRWKRAKHVLYHSKGGFIRVGDRDKFPLTFEGGIEMAAQWGGQILRPDGSVIDMPHGIKDMFKIIFPSGSDSDNPVLIGEVTNVLGNHVGQWSAVLDWHEKGAQGGARLYYEHYFEDHSMMFFDYEWKDMLLGISIDLPRNPVVGSFLYEYLITKDQSGAVYWDHTPEMPEQVSGRDNYYNHGFYPGWEHWGMGIGNPLLVSPIYNADGSLVFRHNRIKAHHVGWKGSPSPTLDYRVLFSYTRSWGTYSQPTLEIERNFGFLLEMTWRPKWTGGWEGRLGIGADGGDMLGKSVGAMLTITRKGWL